MKIYEELVERGLIAQVTNEEEIREMIDNGKATLKNITAKNFAEPVNRSGADRLVVAQTVYCAAAYMVILDKRVS